MKTLNKAELSRSLLVETAQSARRRFLMQAGALTFSGAAAMQL